MALTKIDDRGLKTPIDLQDNEKIRLGTGNDLQIFHDGTNSKVVNSTGSLMTLSDEVRWKNNANNETLFVANANAGVRLFYDNSQKFETYANGCTVTGNLNAGNVDLGDNAKARFGGSNDLEIYHDGSNSYLGNATGDIIIENSGGNTSNQLRFRAKTGEESIVAHGNGAVELYYDNVKKLNTNPGGIKVIGNIACDGDNQKLILGAGDDLQLFHDGSHSYIEAKNTGGLLVGTSHNNNIIFFTNNTNRAILTNAGHFVPVANNTYDLGGSTDRWRNVYTNDLHLSNEGSSNDVDGTWGDWTIQEGESDLFLKNNRSGKKYKFNLTEVS